MNIAVKIEVYQLVAHGDGTPKHQIEVSKSVRVYHEGESGDMYGNFVLKEGDDLLIGEYKAELRVRKEPVSTPEISLGETL